MNNHFLAHIIRDIFKEKAFTVYYGLDISFIETLRTSEHGIGVFHLHSEDKVEFLDDSIYWNAELNDCSFSSDVCDLFISIDYHPNIGSEYHGNYLSSIERIIKPGGYILLINPMKTFYDISDNFIVRNDLVKECKRYSLLRDAEVIVYESI